MALKGTTKIELTNVKTGKVEVIEKHNLITNAVPLALENPFAIQQKGAFGSGYFTGNQMPLCSNLFGGILLYADSIPENADQLYAQTGNKLIGYSSMTVNGTTDNMRGSLNQTESGFLETNDGYRFVFDFETSQANGTISAVGLTSKWGGLAGYGSAHYKNTVSPRVLGEYYSAGSKPLDGYRWLSVMHYDDETGIATAVYSSDRNTVVVDRMKLNTKNYRLTGTANLVNAMDPVESTTLTTRIFAAAQFADQYYSYHNFCADNVGYIWGFENANNANGNSSGNASVNWIKISLADLSFTEGTWEISAQLYPVGRHPLAPGRIAYKPCDCDQANSAILDGYLYCLSYDLSGIYKINLSNVTDVQFIPYPDGKIEVASISSSGSGSIYYYYYYSIANILSTGNKICLWNGWLNVDEIVPEMYNKGYNPSGTTFDDGYSYTPSNFGSYPLRNAMGAHGTDIGVFRIAYGGHGSTSDSDFVPVATLALNSPYLATINNLQNPVQKTADKTMKITYILREE